MIKNVLAQELIGRNIKVVEATNKGLVGTEGKVIDETKNTITVEQGNAKKVLLKEQITFTTTIKNTRIKIDGKKVIGKPEKRR